jgi:hypothetical protein
MKRCLILLVIVIALMAVLLHVVDRSPPVAEIDYAKALVLTDSNAVPWIERGSEAEAAAWERFRDLWSNLTVERVKALLPGVYADSVWFNDTVKTITNQTDLLAYMSATAGHVRSCRVTVVDLAATDEGYYVRWKMDIEPLRGAPGEVWSSIGISHIRLDTEGRVILHQDYWDAASGLYEHFPGIGWILRNIRARL